MYNNPEQFDQFEQPPPVPQMPEQSWFRRYRSWIFPVAAILLIVSAAYAYITYDSPASQTSKSCIEGTPEEECNDTVIVDDGSWKTYKNDEFGFELSFNDAWKGYSVNIETLSQAFGSPTLIKFGFAEGADLLPADIPLTIYVYPISNWNSLTQQAKEQVNYITKTKDHAYAYKQWSKAPADLADKNLEIRKVAESLKLTKLPADNSANAKWNTYKSDTFGFEFQYPNYTTAGGIAPNSSLGTYDQPVKGIYAGSFPLVLLENQILANMANDIVDGAINSGAGEPETSEEGPLPVSCKEHKYSNVQARIKAVSCVGEGGPAFYAVIDGPKTDLFVDGYFNGTAPRIKDEDLPAFFASFKFAE